MSTISPPPKGNGLTDLSVSSTSDAAFVGSGKSVKNSLVGIADDGPHVYFLAQGQLLPGRGKTLAHNEADGTTGLYEYVASSESLRFVATVSAEGPEIGKLSAGGGTSWKSRTSPDGRYLTFESEAKINGYDNAGMPQTYLYDSEAPANQAVRCLSCRPDGMPPAVDPSPSTSSVPRGDNRT